ncbi:unnamed protein product, partial [Penicillium discolor]
PNEEHGHPQRRMHERGRHQRRTRVGGRPRHGCAGREDGHGVRRVRHRPLCGDDAGGGQHPAGRSHARRRLRRARRVARLHGGQPARGRRPPRCRRRHQRHAHPVGHLGRGHRSLHARAPGAQHHGARDRRDRRSGPALLDDPHHQHDQGRSRRGL